MHSMQSDVPFIPTRSERAKQGISNKRTPPPTLNVAKAPPSIRIHIPICAFIRQLQQKKNISAQRCCCEDDTLLFPATWYRRLTGPPVSDEKKNHLPPGLPIRNLSGKRERRSLSEVSFARLKDNPPPTNLMRCRIFFPPTTHHSALASTASLLTSLFLSSRGRASARSTRARNGNTWQCFEGKPHLWTFTGIP